VFLNAKAICLVFAIAVVITFGRALLRSRVVIIGSVITIAWRSDVSILIILSLGPTYCTPRLYRILSCVALAIQLLIARLPPRKRCRLHVDQLAKVWRSNFRWQSRCWSFISYLNDLWNSRSTVPLHTLHISDRFVSQLRPIYTRVCLCGASLMIWLPITLLSPLSQSKTIFSWITCNGFIPRSRLGNVLIVFSSFRPGSLRSFLVKSQFIEALFKQLKLSLLVDQSAHFVIALSIWIGLGIVLLIWSRRWWFWLLLVIVGTLFIFW